jgi:hypothetical protein
MDIQKISSKPVLKHFNFIQNILWNYKFLGRIDLFNAFPGSWRHFYYDKIDPIIDPQNKRYRKIIPKKWNDVSSLIEKVNFEFVKGFYEDEYLNGSTDWSATENHQKFANWLEDSYRYITVERPQLEKDLNGAYPPLRPFNDMFKKVEGTNLYKMTLGEKSYKDLYSEVDRIEKLIEDKDTVVLENIIRNRQYFWT